MKNRLLAIIAIVLASGMSCQKDNQRTFDGKKIPVTFSVPGFSTSIKGITTSSDSANVKANNLSCYVYDVSSGALVETLNQTKANVSFGTLTFNLPPGTYTAAVAASEGNIQWTSASNFNQAHFNTFSSNPHQSFFKRLDSIVVTGPPVSAQIDLKRIVSGLEIRLEDAIPASVSKIVLTVENEGLNFKIAEQQAKGYFTRSYPFSIASADLNTPDKSFATYILPNTIGYKINIRIKALNASGQEIVEKVVPDVLFEVNKKTVLSGKLFDSLNGSNSFTISIDTEWDGTLPIVNF